MAVDIPAAKLMQDEGQARPQGAAKGVALFLAYRGLRHRHPRQQQGGNQVRTGCQEIKHWCRHDPQGLSGKPRAYHVHGRVAGLQPGARLRYCRPGHQYGEDAGVCGIEKDAGEARNGGHQHQLAHGQHPRSKGQGNRQHRNKAGELSGDQDALLLPVIDPHADGNADQQMPGESQRADNAHLHRTGVQDQDGSDTQGQGGEFLPQSPDGVGSPEASKPAVPVQPVRRPSAVIGDRFDGHSSCLPYERAGRR
jgi:hypothetical protein